VKVAAVSHTSRQYRCLEYARVVGVKVDPGVPQPLTLEQTVRGAMNRAIAARKRCTYGIGIEDGLMDVPNSHPMNVCVADIYDGRRHRLGLSSAFCFPPSVSRLLLQGDIDASHAFYNLGLTDNREIGSAEGIVGVLTKGRLDRKDYTCQALQMAMIQLENDH